MVGITKITKEIARQWLADVPEEKRFWCCDGRVLKSLSELEAVLKDMSDDTFRYHSNEVKHDFSNWVKDVIGDERLSQDLLESSTCAQAAKSLASRITWLRNKK